MPSAAAGCCGCRWRWGLGIAVYFELPSEPALWLGPAIAGGAAHRGLPGAGGSKSRALVHRPCGGGFDCLGSSPGGPPSLAAPTLSRPLFSINVEGRIADIQRLPERRAGRARGGAAEGQRRAAARDDAGARAGVAGQGRAAARMSATGCWCWPTSRRRPARHHRAPSISSGSPGTSNSAPSAMRWRRRW